MLQKVKIQIAVIRVTEVLWPKPTVGKPLGRTLRLKLILINSNINSVSDQYACWRN